MFNKLAIVFRCRTLLGNGIHSCLYQFSSIAKTKDWPFSNCNLHIIQKRRFSQNIPLVSEINEPETKVLKISIIGTPNTGKSTFINQIVGRRVFAASSKVHTTRARARAVVNLKNTQVIFLDTPGLVTQIEASKHHLEASFIKDGELALSECNILGVIHDVSNSFTRGRLDFKVLRLLHLYPHKHSVLILNKVDTIKKKRYLLELADRLTCKKLNNLEAPRRQEWAKMTEDDVLKEVKKQIGWPHFHQVFMVSALEGLGVGEVMEYLLQYAKPGKWPYASTVYTDQKPQTVICEAVKARMLDHLPNEIPYSCQVKLEMYNELRDGTIMAVVLVTCPHLRCEKMVLKRIRQIAQETEAELRNTFITQVLVKLVVQTVEDK